MRDVLLDELADLLVDGNRLQREALRRVELTDAVVGGDRFRVRLHPRLQITDLQQCPSVVRILLDDSLVLLDRLVELLLVDMLLSGLEYLLSIDGQMTLRFGNRSAFRKLQIVAARRWRGQGDGPPRVSQPFPHR
jgi:hypothetical protein